MDRHESVSVFSNLQDAVVEALAEISSWPDKESSSRASGVGGGGAKGASAPPKVLICWKFGQKQIINILRETSNRLSNISFYISSYEPPIRLALKECSSTLCCFRKHFHGVLPDIIVRHAFLFNFLLSNAMCGCFVWIEACWIARPCSKMRHIRMDFYNILFHKRWGTSCLSPQQNKCHSIMQSGSVWRLPKRCNSLELQFWKWKYRRYRKYRY